MNLPKVIRRTIVAITVDSVEHTEACPRDGCEGELVFYVQESEDYTAHGLSMWTSVYLMLADPPSCTNGHTFSEVERERIEEEATQEYTSGYPGEP